MNRMTLYQAAFQRANMRMTDQRKVICEWLAQTDRHPTPYDVYQGVAEQHPEISRATVYNTLNTLQQLGAIVEISMGADETHYDTDPTPHINLICLRCHKVDDFPLYDNEHESEDEGEEGTLAPNAGDDPMLTSALSERILNSTGFRSLSARTDVLGICADCALREENAL